MSQQLIDDVVKNIDALSETLTGRDPGAIEQAVERLSEAVHTLRGVGAWHKSDKLRETITNALIASDAARARINVMNDAVDRQLEAVTTLQPGHVGALAYDRQGQPRRAPFKPLS